MSADKIDCIRFAAQFPVQERSAAARLYQLLAGDLQVNLGGITPQSSLQALLSFSDSLDIVEFSMAIEEAWPCSLPGHIWEPDSSLSDLVKKLANWTDHDGSESSGGGPPALGT
jgi:acyl carrier protein